MTTIDVTTTLAAPADAVWGAVTRNGDAFRFVTRGLIRFPPAAAWMGPLAVGDRMSGPLLLLGVVPFSRHTIEVAEVDEGGRRLVTEERGGLLRRWRHTIEVRPAGAGTCRYSDTVEIDAGPLTPVVAAVARVFYRLRQRRWRALAPFLAVPQRPPAP